MTTATADQTETLTGPDLDPQAPKNLPAEVPTKFAEFNLAVRRMLGLEEASDGEIELFFHVCQKSGLDPFNKEIYMIGRNTEVGVYEPIDPNQPDGQKRKVMRWVMKYTIQTGINGFRKRAREIADEKGVEFRQDDPLWCGEDGVWKEVWPDSKPPTAAKFVVYRDGHRYSFIAHYSEFVQTKSDGKPVQMWNKMPCNQTRKCAEVGALQAAFPDELGALVLDDAVQNTDAVVIDEDGNAAPAKQQQTRGGGRGVDALRKQAARSREPEVVDAEPPAEKPPMTAARKSRESRLFKLLAKSGIKNDDREDRIKLYRFILERPEVTTTDDLDDAEVDKVSDQIYKWQREGVADEQIREALNAETIREDNTADDTQEQS